ncbi:MAG: amidohydrolase family protein [Stappiaceae bacterium]
MTQAATYSGYDPVRGACISVHVQNGVIQASEPCGDHGLPLIAPGFVDLQVNGFQGYDLNSGVLDAKTVEALSDMLSHFGVAAYLPTIITASETDICQRLSAIREAQETHPKSRRMIAGIHVEGPAISPKDGPRGAHPEEHVRPPSQVEFDAWQVAAGGLVRMITLAPEIEGSTDFIRYVTSKGVCVALGHCDATDEDIEKAIDAGARMSTHLGNGIAGTLPRHPNAIWTQLSDDRLMASLIVDGQHLPKSTARSMIRAKGIERSILVSDSVMFAGMAPGRYTSPIGGDVQVSENGRISIADTPYLAGSGSSLMDIVRGFPCFTGFPLADAVIMASYNPAKLLGRTVGLAKGAPADFILFDQDEATESVTVRDIIFGGVSVLH